MDKGWQLEIEKGRAGRSPAKTHLHHFHPGWGAGARPLEPFAMIDDLKTPGEDVSGTPEEMLLFVQTFFKSRALRDAALPDLVRDLEAACRLGADGEFRRLFDVLPPGSPVRALLVVAGLGGSACSASIGRTA
jgi:hypothetical protein